MSWGILRKHLVTGTFICGLALLTAQWATTQTRFNVQSSGRGLQNAKMGAQINQLQAENDAQQAELDAKEPHADATLGTCMGDNKIRWNAAINTWSCVEETDPNVQEFARDGYTAPASCASGEILTMDNKRLKCTASSGTGGFEVDPTVYSFVKPANYGGSPITNCGTNQVLTLSGDRLRCISGAGLSNFEVDPTVHNFAKKALPVCGAGQILTADGTDFACVDDGEGVTIEVDPTVKNFAKTNLPSCGSGQVLKGDGTSLSCVSASGHASGTDAGSLDGLNSGQFLRSDANDTATGVITFANQLQINSYIMQNQGSSYDVWLQGSISESGNDRNLALLGVKSTDTLYLNYNREYTGGTVIGGPVTVNGGDFSTNAGHIWSAGGHVGRDANNSIRFDNSGAHWRIDGVWEYYATPTEFRPYANNVNDLGASGARWANGYFAGSVFADRLYGDRIYLTEDIPSNTGHNIQIERSNDTYQSLIGWVKTGTQQFNIGVLSGSNDFHFSKYNDGGSFKFNAPVSAPSFTGSGAGLTDVVTSETDPKVGILTDDKWCKASDGKVVCDQDAPSGGGLSWGAPIPSGGTCSGSGYNLAMTSASIGVIDGVIGITYSARQPPAYSCYQKTWKCSRKYTTSLSPCSCYKSSDTNCN